MEAKQGHGKILTLEKSIGRIRKGPAATISAKQLENGGEKKKAGAEMKKVYGEVGLMKRSGIGPKRRSG